MFNFFKGFYLVLIAIGNNLQSLFLLAVRLYWGWQFFITGIGKFSNIEKIADYFRSLHIPFPELNTYLTASTETIGGMCLLLGLASRLVSIPLAFAMSVALATAHIDAVKTIFEDPQNFVSQPPFNFLLAAIIVFIFGPGKFSIDFLLERFAFKRKSEL